MPVLHKCVMVSKYCSGTDCTLHRLPDELTNWQHRGKASSVPGNKQRRLCTAGLASHEDRYATEQLRPSASRTQRLPATSSATGTPVTGSVTAGLCWRLDWRPALRASTCSFVTELSR